MEIKLLLLRIRTFANKMEVESSDAGEDIDEDYDSSGDTKDFSTEYYSKHFIIRK